MTGACTGQVGSLRYDRRQVGEAERQLVDAHHALRGAEVEHAQRVSDDEARGILLRVLHRVLEVEDDGVGPVQSCVQHELRLAAGQIQTGAAQALTR